MCVTIALPDGHLNLKYVSIYLCKLLFKREPKIAKIGQRLCDKACS